METEENVLRRVSRPDLDHISFSLPIIIFQLEVANPR
jgi:hypothetical protein